MRKVLIADPNTPFATVVGEALRNLGAYEFTLAASGPEALQACAHLKPDLVVVDMDLPECQPAELIQAMRSGQPDLPVIFIPYSADDVPPGLEVQGILTKPFFLPDLPELISRILGPGAVSAPARPTPRPSMPPAAVTGMPAPRTRSAPAPRPPSGPAIIDGRNRPLIEGHVEALSHALRGEPVLLTQGREVITIAPRLSQTAAAALADVVVKAQPAGGPATEVMRFEGDSESARYMLYSLPVGGGLVLSVALRVRLPLPTVRRLVREAADTLAQIATHPNGL